MGVALEILEVCCSVIGLSVPQPLLMEHFWIVGLDFSLDYSLKKATQYFAPPSHLMHYVHNLPSNCYLLEYILIMEWSFRYSRCHWVSGSLSTESWSTWVSCNSPGWSNVSLSDLLEEQKVSWASFKLTLTRVLVCWATSRVQQCDQCSDCALSKYCQAGFLHLFE